MTYNQKNIINYGPLHPAVHGALRLILELDGEKVTNIEPEIGYMHRGIEKIIESRTYKQAIVYMDRVDYVSAVSNEYSFVLAAEKLANIEVPIKHQYIRVLIAELTRISNHLIHFNMLTYDTGALSPFVWAMEEREKIMQLFDKICGARMHLNFFTLGGANYDITSDIFDDIQKVLSSVEKTVNDIENVITENAIFINRTKNIGIISAEDAINIGATGPVLRAAGIAYDLRKKQPYDVYNELNFKIPVGTNGDCYDRYLVKVLEIYESIKIIKQCIERLPEFEFKKCKICIPKKGQTYVSTEAPKGEFGVFLVSDGTNKPYRCHIRSSGFPVLMNIKKFVDNLADLPVVLASLDIVLGEVDR